MSESAKKSFVVCTYVVLILSTLLVYWQVRNFDFVDYDDSDYVYENPDILNGLSFGSFIAAFTTPHVGNWLPLTWLSFILDSQLFGLDPGRMHLVNVLLHLVNTLLLFAVLKKMTGALWPSAFVAAAFALHPMHVESVTWITERKDVLSTFFLLLTLAAYIGYVKRPSIFRYLITLALFVIGLLAKPMLVTLPLLLLLLDYWPLGRFDSHQTLEASSGQKRQSTPAHDKRRVLYRLIIEKIPFFVLAAASGVVTFFVQRSSGAVPDLNILPLHSRVANAFLSYATYIGKMFWPQNLAIFYPFDASTIGFWQVVLCVFLIIVITVLAIRSGRKRKYLFVGWFWFVLALVPVIGLIQSGAQSLADRYTYIPYIGLFIMIAWGLPELLSKWPYRKIALGIAAAIALTVMGIGTYRQVSYWKNSFTLFTHAIEVTQNSDLAYNGRGVVYTRLGRWQEAMEDFKQAIKIAPDHAKAHTNLGIVYTKLGRGAEAIDAHKLAIRIKPDLVIAYNNLGVSYEGLGRYQDAIDAYKQAVRIKPDYAEAYKNLGFAYGKLDRWQEATEAFRQVIRIKPNDAEACRNLGFAYGKLGRWQDAVGAFRQAIKINPDDAKVHHDLGITYIELGRRQEAIEAFRQAIKIKPDFAEARHNLANELAGEGRCDEALDQYRAALRLKGDWPDCMNNLAFLMAANPGIKDRDVNEAIRLASRACQLTNDKNPAFLDTLAAAYASAGKFSEAVDTAKKALDLADVANQSQLKNTIVQHLSFYTQGKPYIEPIPKP